VAGVEKKRFAKEMEEIRSSRWHIKSGVDQFVISRGYTAGIMSHKGALIGHLPSRQYSNDGNAMRRMVPHCTLEVYRGWWLCNDEVLHKYSIVHPDGSVSNGMNVGDFEGTSGEFLRLYLGAVDKMSRAHASGSWYPGRIHECPEVITAQHLVKHQLNKELCHRGTRAYQGPWRRYKNWKIEFDEQAMLEKWDRLNDWHGNEATYKP